MSYPYSHLRTDWENPAQTIGDNTNSGPFPWTTADLIAVHYTAANTIPDDTAAYLRAIQNDYVTNRGYSIGYGVAVTQTGETWQLRGVDWQNAANRNMNDRTFTILVLVDGAEPLTAAALDAVRSLVAWFRSVSPHASAEIVGHQEIGATACPGVGVQTQINNGELEPLPEGDDMRVLPTPIRVYDSREHEIMGPGEIRTIAVGDHAAVFVNFTATETMNPGYLTAWATGPRPTASNVNWMTADETIANTAWVPVVNGHIQLFNRSGSHIIVDLQAVSGP